MQKIDKKSRKNIKKKHVTLQKWIMTTSVENSSTFAKNMAEECKILHKKYEKNVEKLVKIDIKYE